VGVGLWVGLTTIVILGSLALWVPWSHFAPLLPCAVMLGLFAGVVAAPLALLEAWAATRPSRPIHMAAAAATIPLAVVAILGLALQLGFLRELARSGQVTSSVSTMLRFVGRHWDDLSLTALLWICAFLPAFPLTSYVRLRSRSYGAQVLRVVPSSLLWSALLCGAASWSWSLGEPPRGGSGVLANLNLKPLFAVLGSIVACVVATTLAMVLPGAYRRADQLEHYLTRKLWPEDVAPGSAGEPPPDEAGS
jgi:hypothetical protein